MIKKKKKIEKNQLKFEDDNSRNTRLRLFKIIPSMEKSQKQVIYKSFTT